MSIPSLMLTGLVSVWGWTGWWIQFGLKFRCNSIKIRIWSESQHVNEMLEHSCMFRFTISYLRFPNATGKRLLVGHFYIGQMFLGDSWSEQLQCGAGLLIRQRWAYQILPSHVSLNLFSIPGMLWSLLVSAFVQWANRLVINPLPHERQHLASSRLVLLFLCVRQVKSETASL